MMTPGEERPETEMSQMQQTPAQSADVGESLPSPEEIIASVNPRPKRKPAEICQRKGCLPLVFFVCAIVLVILVSVALALGLSGEEEGERKSSPESIQAYVSSIGLSDPAMFENEDSPQSQAAWWMANVDEMNMATPSTATSPAYPVAYQFVIRYAMAVLYYSTQGILWVYQLDFLSNKETCLWNGMIEDPDGGYLTYGLICNKKKEPMLLYLDNNRLSNRIPSEISMLTTLTVLDFNGNDELSGTLPDGLCNLADLRSLAIANTKVRGSIPDCIWMLDKLIFMTFSNSALSGRIPVLKGMGSLETLLLDDNGFSGNISKVFDDLPNLKFLTLDNNEFTGVLDSTFMYGNFNIVQIDMSGNNLSGKFPVHLLGHENLRLIDLHGNYFSGQLPDFPSGSPLRFLALHNNRFNGSIPASIGNLRFLEHLDLSSNQLSGNMTNEIGYLENLSYLFLADNTFETDTIPSSFYNLIELEEFSVKSTSRVGAIPEFISTWTKLKLLDLDANEFAGAIPSEIGKLENLEFLLLNNNLLDGEVPTELASLTNIRALFLEDNDLVGDISFLCVSGTFYEQTGDLDGDEILVADCEGNGNIECSCCVCCHPEEEEQEGEDEQCHDLDLISSLDPIWEASYSRAYYDFGNFTRFVDKAWLPN